MEQQLAAMILALVLLALLVMWPGWRSPVMLADAPVPGRWPGSGDDEQQPETDRAPRPLKARVPHAMLAGAVLFTAGVRVALLLTMHA